MTIVKWIWILLKRLQISELVTDSFSYEGVAVRIKAWAIRSGFSK